MTYYVTQKDGVLIEGLTKEQIYELVSSTTGKTPQGVDEAFITKLKEYNKNGNASIWIGSSAEYNAIEVKDQNTLYVVIDDPYFDDLKQTLDDLATAVNNIGIDCKNMMNTYLADINEWMAYVEEELNSNE